jgi:endonuclease YncB( thermonuclease family)
MIPSGTFLALPFFMRGLLYLLTISFLAACTTAEAPRPGYVVTALLGGEVFQGIAPDGTVLTFKLAGVDCVDHTWFPEDAHFQMLASQTREYMYTIYDQKIYIEYDEHRKDPEGRHLVYAYLADGSLFNETLIKDGMGIAEDYLQNHKYLNHFRTLEQTAFADRVGLWQYYDHASEQSSLTTRHALLSMR